MQVPRSAQSTFTCKPTAATGAAAAELLGPARTATSAAELPGASLHAACRAAAAAAGRGCCTGWAPGSLAGSGAAGRALLAALTAACAALPSAAPRMLDRLTVWPAESCRKSSSEMVSRSAGRPEALAALTWQHPQAPQASALHVGLQIEYRCKGSWRRQRQDIKEAAMIRTHRGRPARGLS